MHKDDEITGVDFKITVVEDNPPRSNDAYNTNQNNPSNVYDNNQHN